LSLAWIEKENAMAYAKEKEALSLILFLLDQIKKCDDSFPIFIVDSIEFVSFKKIKFKTLDKTGNLTTSLKSVGETVYHFLTGKSAKNVDSMAMDGYPKLSNELIWAIIEPMINARANSLPEVEGLVRNYESDKRRKAAGIRNKKILGATKRMAHFMVIKPILLLLFVIAWPFRAVADNWDVFKVIIAIIVIVAAVVEVVVFCVFRNAIGASGWGTVGYTVIFLVLIVIVNVIWHEDGNFARNNVFGMISMLVVMAAYFFCIFFCFGKFFKYQDAIVINKKTSEFIARIPLRANGSDSSKIAEFNNRFEGINWNKRFMNHFKYKVVNVKTDYFHTIIWQRDLSGNKGTSISVSFSLPTFFYKSLFKDTANVRRTVDSVTQYLDNSIAVIDSLHDYWYGKYEGAFSSEIKNSYNKQVINYMEELRKRNIDTVAVLGFSIADVLNGRVNDKKADGDFKADISVTSIMAEQRERFRKSVMDDFLKIFKERHPLTGSVPFDLVFSAANKPGGPM
jgi:hypothetical protein